MPSGDISFALLSRLIGLAFTSSVDYASASAIASLPDTYWQAACDAGSRCIRQCTAARELTSGGIALLAFCGSFVGEAPPWGACSCSIP